MNKIKIPLGFKGNLIMVVLLVMIGVGVITSLSLTTLSRIEAADARVAQASQDLAALRQLQTDLLSYERALQTGSQPAAELTRTLDTLSQEHRSALQAIKQQMPAGDLEDQMTALLNRLEAYITARGNWLQEKTAQGWSNESGYRKALATADNQLNEKLLNSLRVVFSEVRSQYQSFLATPNEQTHSQLQQALDKFAESLSMPAYQEFYGEKFATYKKALKQVTQSVFRLSEHEQAVTRVLSNLEQQVGQLDQLMASELLAVARADAEQASQQAFRLLLGSGILISLIVSALVARLSWNVTRSLQRTVTALKKMADGDLRQQVAFNRDRNDELDQLGAAVNQTSSSLDAVISETVTVGNQLRDMAERLNSSTRDMSDNNSLTSEQATALATAIEQISATVQQMATDTNQAHKLASETEQSASDGAQVINRALNTLGDISTTFTRIAEQQQRVTESSARVDHILDVINGLAEQTNLLALNAAIEAARAGDAGRGFSVVADEVRGLAEKTVKATQDIDNILESIQRETEELGGTIEDGTRHAEQGSELGNQAVKALDSIQQGVGDVVSRNQQVAASIEEVAQTAVDMNGQVESMVDRIKHNDHKSQALLELVETLSERSTNLERLTSRFKH